MRFNAFLFSIHRFKAFFFLLPNDKRPIFCFATIGVLSALFAVSGCGGSGNSQTSQTSTPLSISTSSLPNGNVGTLYNATLAATGGTTPYAWAVTSGSLPAGLSLNSSTGAITGTPTTTANATALIFSVADASTPTQSKSVSLTLTISAQAVAPLAITTTSLPNGQVGNPYSAMLAATGGTTPYSWALTAGLLPAGLSLNSSTGAISGSPTASATATSLTFKVTDAGSPAQTQSVTLSLTVNPLAPLTVITTSLPNGQVGTAYSASLAATGGTTPYAWSLTSGTLPAGLSLNASTGVLAGTPTATANATALAFTVTDSSTPAQTKPLNLTLNVSPSTITLTVAPTEVGITISQSLTVTATTNDYGGVNWTASGSGCTGASCGTFSANNSLTGGGVNYTPPSTGGVYTLTATSTTQSSVTATVSVAVTDLSGVTTHHNNLSRNGANTQEYLLSPATVTTSTFGKLFSCTVDEAIYTQPLWVPHLAINGAARNVVFVATQNDGLYAFDADSNTTPCMPLWHDNLLDAAHGGTSGETSVQSFGTGYLVGGGGGDIAPEVGVTGTPVIDPTTNTLYVVSKSVIRTGPTFFQRLHAIDLTTGNEKFAGPVNIAATFPGNGDGGSTTTFVAQQENQRCALALVNGTVYIAWAAHEDTPPWYGWIIGYNAANLAQSYVFNVDPNTPSSPLIGTAGAGGIWMAGGAPAADSAGNLYLLTANGAFDPTTQGYGDSLLQLSPSLTVNQYFTPTDQQSDNDNDADFGAGGAAVLVDLPVIGTNPTHLVVGGGKDGALYVLNRDKMGGYGDSGAWQRLFLGHGIFSTPAFWNSTLFVSGSFGGQLQAFTLNPQTAQLTAVSAASPEQFSFFGPSPSVSSRPDASNGIAWLIDATSYCTSQSLACGPAVLRAYDATNLANELWNSSQGTGNAAGNAVKFTVPTIANGKVYVGTRGNNTGGADNSTSIPGELDVYGVLPN